MARILERYWDDESGNRFVDWLVLGAGVLMLGTAILATAVPGNRALASGETPAVVTGDA